MAGRPAQHDTVTHRCFCCGATVPSEPLPPVLADGESNQNQRPVPGLNHHRLGDTEVVLAPAEVDVYTAGGLRDFLRELAPCPRLAVDLRRTTLVDAAGLRVLLAAQQKAKHDGSRLTIICDREPLLRTLRETHLDKVLDIRESLE